MVQNVRTKTLGKNGRCACDEGYVAVYDYDFEGNVLGLSHFAATELYVHDCGYIRLRNSKIKEAEKMSRQLDVPFLKCMDFLMNRAPEDGTAYAMMNGFATSPRQSGVGRTNGSHRERRERALRAVDTEVKYG